MWERRLQRSWPLGLPVSAAFSCSQGAAGTESGRRWSRAHVPDPRGCRAKCSAQRARVVLGSVRLWAEKTARVLRDARPDRGCARPGRKSAQAVGGRQPHFPHPVYSPRSKQHVLASSRPRRRPSGLLAASWPHPQHPCLSSNGLPDARDRHGPGAPYAPCSWGWHPGLPPRDGGSHTKSPARQAGLAGQSSKQTGRGPFPTLPWGVHEEPARLG